MAFMDHNNINPLDSSGGPAPAPPGNRPFVIAAGSLAAIALLAIGTMVVYALAVLPARRAQQAQYAATLEAQNTAVALAITQTSVADAATPVPTQTPTQEPSTATPSPTSLLAVATSVQAVAATSDARTATVSALLTQAAVATQTLASLGPSPTALPATGFADEVGLPAMTGLAVLLIGVIIVARRLRTA